MGYYSFYKVIKDILQTIFGRKFLRLLLIILITIPIASFICSHVFAFDFYCEELGDTIVLPDEAENNYTYLFTTRTSNGTSHLKLIISSTPLVASNHTAGTTKYYKFEPIDNGYIIGDGYCTSRNILTAEIISGYISSVYQTYDETKTVSYILLDAFTSVTSSKAYVSADITLPNGTVYKANDGLVPNHNPHFTNANDMLDYDFNNMYINMGSFGVDDVIYLHKLEVDRTFEEDTGVIYYKQSVFKLHSDSDYYGITNDLVSYYSIPRSDLNLSSDKEYLFVLNDNASSINATNGLYTDDTAYDILHLEPNNSVVTPEKEQNDAIKGNTDAIKEQTNSINNLSNTITSNDYDESQIQIDGSLSENIDENSYTNFITEIINSINNAITCDWNTVETVEIPLGFVDESITWKSDILSAHVPQSLKLIINTFWMFLFGFYIFKFSLSLVNWLKSGEILDGKGFNSDEVITSNML